MAESHPYVSGAGNVVQAVTHLRKSFPSIVKADTFKKLGIASNNESYVINTLRFIGVLDADGKKHPPLLRPFHSIKMKSFRRNLAHWLNLHIKIYLMCMVMALGS